LRSPPASPPKRVAVLVSGRGSNLEALIAAAQGDFPARIELVVSDNPAAPALDRARKAGIATEVIARADTPDRAGSEAAIHRRLIADGIEIVCLAGFMRILSADFVGRREGRILNVHPSLLPAFRGLDTHARALAAGVKIHGATVHLVTADLDAGPILIQAAVPVLAGDDEVSLAARVLKAEHRIYPEALRRVALALSSSGQMANASAASGAGGAEDACLISPPA
jgi:formyltetrahydrofolate-dependent phosphoribosylglycinamide formyltransferase